MDVDGALPERGRSADIELGQVVGGGAKVLLSLQVRVFFFGTHLLGLVSCCDVPLSISKLFVCS